MIWIWIRSFSLLLVYNVEYLIAFCCGGSSSAVVESGSHSTISFGRISFILIKSLVFRRLWSTIWSSHFVHKVSIEHCLSHLLCVVSYLAHLTRWAEASCLCLVEDMLVLVDSWKHLMDTWVIGGLQHYTRLCPGTHFINAERSVLIDTWLCSSLLSHSIGHEEGLILILFATTKPVVKRKLKIKEGILTFHLSY